ncbi:MAG: metallophosphoesterase family protein [Thermodesulfobacteriota bacterium]
MGSIYAIGDIHGCLDKLRALMDQVEPEIDPAQDTLVFLGDYIDRGPSSFDVVEYLIRLKARFTDVVFLKGNHEEMLELYLNGVDRTIYLMNGGNQTLENYLDHSDENEPDPIPVAHRNFLSSLTLFHETEEYIFVHAGLKEKVPLDRQKHEDLLWIREKFIYSTYDFEKQVVFGHTPFTEPLVMPNKIGVDTGAVYGNKLTCVKLPQLEFFHA